MLTPNTQAILIADLGYGDAGKGSIVDFLARTTPAHTVVRYNGGAQAAHNVVTPEGRHHTFAQFGSASFVPGVRTHLSRFMLLHPLAMLAEERHLRALGVIDAFERTTIERGALVISPFQQAANRIREAARGAGRHGSCGMGVGETRADALACPDLALTAGELGDRARVIRKLRRLQDLKIAQLEPLLASLPPDSGVDEEVGLLLDAQMPELTADLFEHFAGRVALVEPDELGRRMAQPGVTIFEGAQGVLLDEWWGFYPYNSWSALTFQNADTLLAESGFSGAVTRLGLLRGYATRHGAGPFVSEDTGLMALLQDDHNRANPWQQQFRVGALDLLALRYALRVSGPVNGLAVTNLDRMQSLPEWPLCEAYRYPGDPADLDGFFEHQGERVSAICVPEDPTDLARQERLTHLLAAMQPVNTPCAPDTASYLEQISCGLGAPVVLTSAGPTAQAKAWRPVMSREKNWFNQNIVTVC